MAEQETTQTPMIDKMNEQCDQLLSRANWIPLKVKDTKSIYMVDQQTEVYDLCRHSPFANITEKEKVDFVEMCKQTPRIDKCIGALVGLAIGDYTGAPLEFLPILDFETIEEKNCIFTEEGPQYPSRMSNKFRLLPGQWTDDSAMGLCIADSLLKNSAFNGSDIRVRFWSWWFRGYNNSFRKDERCYSVGLGGNISHSLLTMKPNQTPAPRFEHTSEDAGNGSLMRLSPIPIFFHDNIVLARNFARESSLTTHPGPIAREACALMAHIIVEAINNENNAITARDFLERVTTDYLTLIEGETAKEFDLIRRLIRSEEEDTSKERNWNWKNHSLMLERTLALRGTDYNGYPVSAGYFGSYCLDGLAIALHAVYHTTSFETAVLRVVNMRGDCDTTGAIAGQIAGAFYGHSQIPQKMISPLNKWDDHEFALRAALLAVSGPRAQNRTNRTEENVSVAQRLMAWMTTPKMLWGLGVVFGVFAVLTISISSSSSHKKICK